MSPEVYDCFTFSTELDLLAFRLDLLADVVDHVVIVEATRTFSGLPKTLLFTENRERFAAHLGRITHVVVDDMPDPVPDRWVLERFQRNAIARGLIDADAGDIAIITDVDEIPDPARLRALRDLEFDHLALEMRLCYYRADLESPQRWTQARAARVGALLPPDEERAFEPTLVVREAGAHFSYIMNIDEVSQKYRWFAHDELDSARSNDPRFLELAMHLGIFAPHRLMLDQVPPETWSPVQRALYEVHPEFFRSRPLPPNVVRRACRAYFGARNRPRLPDMAVHTLDAALARITGSR